MNEVTDTYDDCYLKESGDLDERATLRVTATFTREESAQYGGVNYDTDRTVDFEAKIATTSHDEATDWVYNGYYNRGEFKHTLIEWADSHTEVRLENGWEVTDATLTLYRVPKQAVFDAAQKKADEPNGYTAGRVLLNFWQHSKWNGHHREGVLRHTDEMVMKAVNVGIGDGLDKYPDRVETPDEIIGRVNSDTD